MITRAKNLTNGQYRIWYEDGTDEVLDMSYDLVMSSPTEKQKEFMRWRRENKVEPFMLQYEKNKIKYIAKLKNDYHSKNSYTKFNGFRFANTRRTKEYLYTEIGTYELVRMSGNITIYDIDKKPLSCNIKQAKSILRDVTFSMMAKDSSYEQILRDIQSIMDEGTDKGFIHLHPSFGERR